MDKITERIRLEEILAEWDLKEDYEVDLTSISMPDGDTITVGASQTSPYTYTSGISLGAYPNAVYTTNGATTAPWMTHNPTGAKIQLDGEESDITVNGWSLVDAVKRIEERLGLYQPNSELEAEWEDLKALAEKYRKLEQHIRDKQATFERLKAMPPPEIE